MIFQGMLPGGGAALLYSSRILDYVEFENEEQRFGKEILKKALKRPVEVLMGNGGLNGRYITEYLLTSTNDNMIGYDLNSGMFFCLKKLLNLNFCFIKIHIQIWWRKVLWMVF